ncbi:UDP-N-acetylglucosamine 4,6-dehydratase (inverting) [Falsiroseomonas sp.]|uniref:UDP-N-acetylglucosamine 4,6-dehydratase (inverting) n=1 Tax=Falsiroseomonas sp. TaxID=2870721 RepID=UPI0034A3692A
MKLISDIDACYKYLDGKSILVTGGTGSFGRHFVMNVLKRAKPRRLIVLSRDEFKHYEMQQIFRPDQHDCLRFFIGDVRDVNRLNMAMREVDIVIHAAAMKHVPAAEHNPFECLHTNVNGAENVVRSALENRVSRVLALSTDKACNPINLYGASKLASDKIFVAANNLSGSIGTRFSALRYGNVIGSRGSVIPFFRKLIAGGATSLPLTDTRMTRFWIMLQQGVDFAVAALSQARGGEIFVPRIPSMRMTDLARVLAPHLPTHVVGIRPGEKLHEVMVSEDDARQTLELEDAYIIEPAFNWWKRASYTDVGAKHAPEDFYYSSETNTEWITDDQLRAFLRDLP